MESANGTTLQSPDAVLPPCGDHGQGFRIADAGDVRFVADVADEAVEGPPVGAGVHFDKMKTKLKGDAVAFILRLERGFVGVEAAILIDFRIGGVLDAF